MDVFFALSHGVHRGVLKTGKSDDRADFVNKLIRRTNDVKFDIYGLDKVQPKAVKKKFKNRKDKDIDNDGDVDDSDKFLHKKRKAISKAVKKEEGSLKVDGRNKTFKEKLRALGYVKEKSLIYNNKKSGK